MKHRDAMYKQIYEYLFEQINNGKYSIGATIPTEHELMKQFGVSRMTTNRALQMLTLEGFIERKAGVGSFVVDWKTNRSDTERHGSVKAAHDEEHGVVGFVVPFFSPDYGITLLSELEKLLDERGMTLAVACSYAEQEHEAKVIQRLLNHGVQGLVVFPVNGDYYNAELLRLHIEEFPLVLVDKHLPGIPLPYVTTDNEQASATLTKHLIDLGHKHIGFASPPVDDTTSLVERLAGFKLAMAEADLTTREEFLLTDIALKDTGEVYHATYVQKLSSFFKAHEQVSAMVATDHGIAQHVYEAARNAGRSVPEELSIVCFDGPLPHQQRWNYTHIMQDEKGMAKHTMDMLMSLMHRKDEHLTTVYKLPGKLYVGDSTAVAKSLSVICK